jgi:hypothetical protein
VRWTRGKPLALVAGVKGILASMSHSIIISIVAILISIANSVFSFYQYRKNLKFKYIEKANTVLKKAYDIRLFSQDLKYLIDMTDDIDDMSLMFEKYNNFIDSGIQVIFLDKKTIIADLFDIEKTLHDIELELNLTKKSVDELIRFRKEVKDSEKKHL